MPSRERTPNWFFSPIVFAVSFIGHAHFQWVKMLFFGADVDNPGASTLSTLLLGVNLAPVGPSTPVLRLRDARKTNHLSCFLFPGLFDHVSRKSLSGTEPAFECIQSSLPSHAAAPLSSW